MRVGEFLVIRGLVTADQVEAALQRQREQGGGRLGGHLAALGIMSDAELAAMLPSLQRWQVIHGPNHPNRHRARYSYARALLAAGRPAESLSHAETALIGHLESLGEDHPWTREVRQLVADARRAVSLTSGELPAAAGWTGLDRC